MLKDFPLTDTYESASGKTIEFEVKHDESAAGYRVTAQETPKSRGRRFGYCFTSFSPISPYLALGELRLKIRRELSVRYLGGELGDLAMTHDRLLGRITFSKDDGEIIIEADGRKVTRENLWAILATHEGFEVEIRIREQ